MSRSMKPKISMKAGAVGAIGIAALGGAFLAGRHWPVAAVRVVEKEIVEVRVPEEARFPERTVVPQDGPAVTEEVKTRRAMDVAERAVVDGTKPVDVDTDACVQTAEDGSRVVWFRTKDGQGITKYDLAADGSLSFLTDIRTDKNGNPLRAKVYDWKNELVYQASYGYNRHTGALAAELLFDKRPEAAPAPAGQELPVRRVNYGTDATHGQTQTIEPPPARALAENGAEAVPMPAPYSSMVFPRP